jgi:hypothetical protein
MVCAAPVATTSETPSVYFYILNAAAQQPPEIQESVSKLVRNAIFLQHTKREMVSEWAAEIIAGRRELFSSISVSLGFDVLSTIEKVQRVPELAIEVNAFVCALAAMAPPK